MSTEKEKTIIAFDSSELDNFQACLYKWNLINHRHLQPRVTKGYFETGSLLHYLLELHYKWLKSYHDGEKKKEEYDIEEIVELGRVKSLEYEIELPEISEVIFQFREYIRYYGIEEGIIPLYIEEPFMIKIYEDEDIIVYLTGKPDLIFKYVESGSIAVMDHKSVRRESPISPLRNQFNLYATAMKTDTVIINKIGFQKTKEPRDRFTRAPMIYHQEHLDEWKEQVIQSAKEMVLFQKLNHYPMNRTSCEKWDGCFFQRFCSTRPSAREFLVGREYIVSPEWDVSKVLEGKGEEK